MGNLIWTLLAARLAADEQRPTVALRFRELDSGDARLNFTHYLYMRFANNSGNYHKRVGEDMVQSACGKSTKLREALAAACMRDCFRAQAVSGAYAKYLQPPDHILEAEDAQDLLQQDVFSFMQRSPKGVLLVQVDEHRSMCPDPDFRRGAMILELPGVQVVATYTDIPPLPKQKSSETCRRPIACLLPDVGTIMKERLPMDDIGMGNEAILLLVAALRVTLGLALQKLLLAGLHFPSSQIDRLLRKLNNMLGNAGDNVQARLEKCIAHCNRIWMEEWPGQVTSLVDLLCGMKESDDSVQEKRFPHVVALDDILTAPLEVILRDEDDDLLSPAQHATLFLSKFVQVCVGQQFVANGDCRENSRTCLPVGAVLPVQQVRGDYVSQSGSVPVQRRSAPLHLSEEHKEPRLCQSCGDAELHSLLCRGEPSVCRHFLQG